MTPKRCPRCRYLVAGCICAVYVDPDELEPDNEWYTPPEIAHVVRRFFGGDFGDPASSALANDNLRATGFYTENGHARPWWRRTYVNPPFCGEIRTVDFAEHLVKQWDQRGLRRRRCDQKVADTIEADDIDEIIWLSQGNTATAWYSQIHARASGICMIPNTYRLQFWRPDRGEVAQPVAAVHVLYFGHDARRFRDEFEHLALSVRVKRYPASSDVYWRFVTCDEMTAQSLRDELGADGLTHSRNAAWGRMDQSLEDWVGTRLEESVRDAGVPGALRELGEVFGLASGRSRVYSERDVVQRLFPSFGGHA